jgi:DNA-binding NarL/FixJ family response regulator
MEVSSTFSVLHLGKNLFFLAQLKAMTEAAGGTLIGAANLEEAMRRVSQPRPHMLVIDLSNLTGDDFEKIPALLQLCPEAAVLAFGPHRQPQLFKKARSAGIQAVVPNSRLTKTFLDTLGNVALRVAAPFRDSTSPNVNASPTQDPRHRRKGP